MFEDTIAAISTSTLTKTAISIVRISGKDAFTVLNKIFKKLSRLSYLLWTYIRSKQSGNN